MLRSCTTLVFCFVFACCWLEVPCVYAQSTTIKQLNWILGSWSQPSKRGTMQESWKQVSPDVYRGQGVSISDTGEKKIIEEMLILKLGGSIYYLVKVGENPFPVPFRLVASSTDRAIFENPDHDFPQKLNYHRTSTGKLEIEVSNQERSLRFSLSSSPPPPAKKDNR